MNYDLYFDKNLQNLISWFALLRKYLTGTQHLSEHKLVLSQTKEIC